MWKFNLTDIKHPESGTSWTDKSSPAQKTRLKCMVTFLMTKVLGAENYLRDHVLRQGAQRAIDSDAFDRPVDLRAASIGRGRPEWTLKPAALGSAVVSTSSKSYYRVCRTFGVFIPRGWNK